MFIFLIGRLLTFAIRPVVTFGVNSEVQRLGVGIPISSRRLRSPSLEPRRRGHWSHFRDPGDGCGQVACSSDEDVELRAKSLRLWAS